MFPPTYLQVGYSHLSDHGYYSRSYCSSELQQEARQAKRHITEIQLGGAKFGPFLPLGEAVASRAAFVIVSGSDGRAEALLEPAK